MHIFPAFAFTLLGSAPLLAATMTASTPEVSLMSTVSSLTKPIEEPLEFDHTREQIADFKGPSVKHYSEVLTEIRDEFARLSEEEVGRGISLGFHANYLQDEGVKALADYILSDERLKTNLVTFDLSNNRFTSSSLGHLKRIVSECPRLQELNIAINYLGHDDYLSAFGDLESKKRKLVHFSNY